MSQVYISLGTNVNRDENLQFGLKALSHAFGSLELSSLFESEAVGFKGPIFYNMVIGVFTDFDINKVATLLRDIEYTYGREKNAQKYSPRTLDLDLLLYDDLILQTPAQIPRDEITKNAFVLWPLAEVAGDKFHPVYQKTYQQLWQNFDKSKQKLIKIPFQWSASTEAN